MNREYIIRKLNAVSNADAHIIGAVSGSGMTAKYATMGGADFLLALSAGKFRNMGRGSLASYFCFGNSNDIVMDMGKRELLPLLPDIPILFGLFASDPTIDLRKYLSEIKAAGFSGIVNFPTVALIDGKFREALEEEGNSYDLEVEAIRTAHELDMFTVGFVTDEEQTYKMLRAGVDVVCVHFGVTKGGFMGASKFISLSEARDIADRLFAICEEQRPEAIRMVYAGPANTSADARYLYGNTACQGYIGGSTFDRIPSEKAIIQAIRDFRAIDESDPLSKVFTGELNSMDYVAFIREFIEEHYQGRVQLGDLALLLHVSPSYLSTRFSKEVGCSFTEYLIRFRMDKAREMLKSGHLTCREAAERSGYDDYAQFSKTFRKYTGHAPSYYLNKSGIER